ncbi:LysR family transcriptional regulator [Nocardioides alpinus]|uniref:LysR family transcriptional regulator n=1 Tax=Nocardioides alpinus TaxID=748909 RepID=A0ABX4QTD6_9ACTN|nr:LysR family transcriptional regulator [Nocardioides alpinus]PKH37598.1 LysR family transcriptional regulator [Nocardioides alpinus]
MLIRDLSWLLELGDAGHVTEAAATIGTSQPTLSRALARLEDELGVRIFERLPTGVSPTPEGEIVIEAARDLVARHDLLVAALTHRLDPDSGMVRLAFLDSMATTLVPRLLRAFHAQAPGIKVVLSQEPTHHIHRDLDRGVVELGLTMDRAEGHAWLPVRRERLVVVVPPGHRLRHRKRVGLAELADDELVTTPAGFAHRALVDGLLADAGISPTISFESADLATIEGLVAAGLGVAVVPEAFAGQSGSVGLALSSPGATRTIGLTWRTDRPLAPPAQRLVDFVRGQGWDD